MIDIKQQIIEQLFLPSELAAWYDYSSDDIRVQIKDSIDRIDNSKGYSMDNCRWANSDIQNHNQYRVGKDRKADIALYKSLVAEYGYPPPKY